MGAWQVTLLAGRRRGQGWMGGDFGNVPIFSGVFAFFFSTFDFM
jgi:hypothetical protein